MKALTLVILSVVPAGTAALAAPGPLNSSGPAMIRVAQEAEIAGKGTAGSWWLSVTLYNVSDRKATKRAVVALAQKAAGRL